jgi:hypothetical protein
MSADGKHEPQAEPDDGDRERSTTPVECQLDRFKMAARLLGCDPAGSRLAETVKTLIPPRYPHRKPRTDPRSSP